MARPAGLRSERVVAIGPLLNQVLTRLEADEREQGFITVASVATESLTRAAAHYPASTEEAVAVTAILRRGRSKRGEPWAAYRAETLARLGVLAKRFKRLGIEAQPLVSATALQFQATPEQLGKIAARYEEVELLELDPLLDASLLDDVAVDIELSGFRGDNPDADGEGVTVAVLDTGVDMEHPFLEVAESISTCAETVGVPGEHGTHCAGILASRDEEFRGVAPGVRLVNIKVGRANGRVLPGDLSRGFDHAADLQALIIAVSLGFNHRPIWSVGGHGWSCRRRPCVVCRAVETAVQREQQLVVVAAGNEHQRAEAMRSAGDGDSFDTELCCPGQARAALTVGSITKRTMIPASTSSHGPSSRGAAKPDICAPGVNVTSTTPVPRGADGHPVRESSRRDLFGRRSGTSMATPVVAGIAALLAHQMMRRGKEPSPSALRRQLMSGAQALPFRREVVGVGRARLP